MQDANISYSKEVSRAFLTGLEDTTECTGRHSWAEELQLLKQRVSCSCWGWGAEEAKSHTLNSRLHCWAESLSSNMPLPVCQRLSASIRWYLISSQKRRTGRGWLDETHSLLLLCNSFWLPEPSFLYFPSVAVLCDHCFVMLQTRAGFIDLKWANKDLCCFGGQSRASHSAFTET